MNQPARSAHSRPIIPDVNLLIYAYDSGSFHHEKARQWLENELSGDALIGFISPVLLGFIRLTTNSRVMHRPLSLGAAIAEVKSWLNQPFTKYLSDSPEVISETMRLLEKSGASRNLTTDATIAAYAIFHKGTVASHDTDFLKFPGVSVYDPLQE